MSDTFMQLRRIRTWPSAKTILETSAKFWFCVATIGLWGFVYYLLAYYIGPVLEGGLPALAQTRLPNGYLVGDTIGNLAVAIHLFVAVIIMGGGPLQLIPLVRVHFPRFHRWNGRVYVITAILTSLAGLYMTWIRGDETGVLIQQIAVSLSALLIFYYAYQAWRTAFNRSFKDHRAWALRLFMVANAAWFLRIGYQLHNTVKNGSIAYDPTVFKSDFIIVWNFGQFLVPLLLLELYFHALRTTSAPRKYIVAIMLFVFTLLMGTGVYAAIFGMWLPRL